MVMHVIQNDVLGEDMFCRITCCMRAHALQEYMS